MLDNLVPRQKLIVTPVNYPWSSVDQIYYSQILKDELFIEIVEQSINSYYLRDTFKKLSNVSESISKMTEIDNLKVLNKITYDLWATNGIDSDIETKTNVTNWILAIAHITKIIAYDAIYVLLKEDSTTLESINTTEKYQQDYLRVFYSRIQPAIEVHSRKAIRFLIDTHNNMGKLGEGEDNYRIDQVSDGMLFVKLLIKSLLKEMLICICHRDIYFGGKTEPSIEPTIAGIVDIEMGIITREQPNLDEYETGEIVAARVNHILNIFGVPDIECDSVIKQLCKLAYGISRTDFGLTKRTSDGYGGVTGDKVASKRIHRASNRDKMLSSSSVGQHLLQRKAEESRLTERKRESSTFATGGDVYLLVDCTGSTMPTTVGYGLINLEEAIAANMANVCRETGRKLIVYFYNEGTVKVETFSPSEPEKTFKLKKLNLFGNGGYRNNDEITTFTEIFAELNRSPGKKHSIIFLSDGGMIVGCEGDRETNINKLKLMFSSQPNIEILPILIHWRMDETFRQVFEGRKIIHIEDMTKFSAEHLAECVKIVS
jgi:hypothetical protein